MEVMQAERQRPTGEAASSEPGRPERDQRSTPSVSGERVAHRREIDFLELYAEHFDFVWRTAHRLGVPPSALDDVVQEIFIVVHRRLADFEGRSSLKTWLFGIVRRVTSDYRRAHRRETDRDRNADPDELESAAHDAHASAERRELASRLQRLLGELDEDKRAVLVLAELEQMTAPEIAEAIGIKLNTVYSRLRAARREFNEALARDDVISRTERP